MATRIPEGMVSQRLALQPPVPPRDREDADAGRQGPIKLENGSIGGSKVPFILRQPVPKCAGDGRTPVPFLSLSKAWWRGLLAGRRHEGPGDPGPGIEHDRNPALDRAVESKLAFDGSRRPARTKKSRSPFRHPLEGIPCTERLEKEAERRAGMYQEETNRRQKELTSALRMIGDAWRHQLTCQAHAFDLQKQTLKEMRLASAEANAGGAKVAPRSPEIRA